MYEFLYRRSVYEQGSLSMGIKNLKSGGKSSPALGNIRRYDCRIVTSATPAISPISRKKSKVFLPHCSHTSGNL